VTVVDLHPEDLIEKDANGELDGAERARLDAHLARCAPCRFEQAVRSDFVEELSSEQPTHVFGLAEQPLLETPERRHSSLVPRSSGNFAVPSVRRSKWARGRRKRAAWLLTAAALLVGGAAAAMGLGEGQWPRFIRAANAVPSAPPDPPAPKTARNARRAVAAPSTDAPSVAAVETPEVNAIPESPPPAEPSPPRRPSVAERTPAIGPAELLDAESGARQRGEYERAIEIHRELESRYAASREAQVSRAVAGRLLLDRGDPSSALANFDSYLAGGGGQLREEAMVGRATALDRLGLGDEAARAWGALLTAFPDTPYASHAKARSESLSGL
jgi:TolA-binding protein